MIHIYAWRSPYLPTPELLYLYIIIHSIHYYLSFLTDIFYIQIFVEIKLKCKSHFWPVSMLLSGIGISANRIIFSDISFQCLSVAKHLFCNGKFFENCVLKIQKTQNYLNHSGFCYKGNTLIANAYLELLSGELLFLT